MSDKEWGEIINKDEGGEIKSGKKLYIKLSFRNKEIREERGVMRVIKKEIREERDVMRGAEWGKIRNKTKC